MTLSLSLIKAARQLINAFGNNATLYPYAGVTSTTNDEGEVTVTDWSNTTYTQSFAGPATTCQLTHYPVVSITSATVGGVARAYSVVLSTGVVTPTVALSGGETLVVVYKYAQTTSTIKVVDDDHIKSKLVQMGAGIESIGGDDKIIRDDVTCVPNDRITFNGDEYRVVALRQIRVESTLIIQIITIAKTTSTTKWYS